MSDSYRRDWAPVSASRRCPICGGKDNCTVAVNESAVWCGREPSERQNAGGQFFHRLADGDATYNGPARSSQNRISLENELGKRTACSLDRVLKQSLHPNSLEYLKYWSERYCVPVASWLALGASGQRTRIVIPEFDPTDCRKVTAIVARNQNGESRWMAGTGQCRGVTIAIDPIESPHATIVIEGATDAVAAHAAGFHSIGRHTRDADLAKFAGVLEKVSCDQPIVVLVENDHPKESWTCTPDEYIHHLVSQAEVRADRLADLLGRPVIVATPSDNINDFADWWRVVTDNNGHTLDELDRHRIGGEMRDILVSTGSERVPSIESIKEYRDDKVETLTQTILSIAEESRQEAVDRGQGTDADYEREDSCSFYNAFERRTEENHGTDYLFGHLSCKSWGCPACRRRKLKPEWTIHLIESLTEEVQVSDSKSTFHSIFRKTISEKSLVDLKKRIAAIKKQISRKKGCYASIRQTETDFVIYSTVKPLGACSQYSIRNVHEHLDWLLKMVQLDVEQIEIQHGNPISTSRRWSRGKPATLGDAEYKLSRISEAAENATAQLYTTVLAADDAVDRLRAAQRSNVLLERDARTEFFAVASENESVFVLSSKSLGDTSNESSPEKAVATTKELMMKAVSKVGEDSWRECVRATPRWNPRFTKRWRPLDIRVSPAKAKHVAESLGAKARDLSFEPISAFCDGVTTRFLDTASDRRDEFLSALDEDPDRECPRFTIYNTNILGNLGHSAISPDDLRDLTAIGTSHCLIQS